MDASTAREDLWLESLTADRRRVDTLYDFEYPLVGAYGCSLYGWVGQLSARAMDTIVSHAAGSSGPLAMIATGLILVVSDLLLTAGAFFGIAATLVLATNPSVWFVRLRLAARHRNDGSGVSLIQFYRRAVLAWLALGDQVGTARGFGRSGVRRRGWEARDARVHHGLADLASF